MANVVSAGFNNDYDEVSQGGDDEENIEMDEQDGPNRENGDGPRIKSSALGMAQAGVMNMAGVIAEQGLKKSESTDALHLTLHQCARDGNPDNMRRMLASLTGKVEKKINAHDENDISALHYAARYNHYEIVKMLIDTGADVNDKDPENVTPLHFAARYKRVRLQKSDGTEGNRLTFTAQALFMPSTVQQQELEITTVDNSVILYLVHRGAKVNAQDIYGCPPLHYAAMRGNELATQELLSCNGILIAATDKQNMTALHLAASHNEVEICRMLITKGANLRSCDEDLYTPLHYACAEGNLEIAKMLFEAGEKQDGWVTVSQMVTDQDMAQNTPLHLAVENRSFEVAKLCIEKGADVNTPSDNYSTPLHSAAVVGDLDIVKLLVDNKARVDALDINQSTPLHRAAAYNNAEIVEYLLDKRAKIDKHDKDNFTPLLIAACNGHAETITTLLAKGADIFAVDKNDKSAIYWCAEEDKVDALKELAQDHRAKYLLEEDDAYGNAPMHIAAEKGHLQCVRALLEAGADLDAKNEEERTPLHLAAMFGKVSVIKELLKRDRMALQDEDEDSNTALHLASLAGHRKVVETLLSSGADIEARNCNLWTPLDCAAAKGWLKTCKVLLENDAPVDPMDKTKTTPLHLASAKGHTRVVQLLINWHASVGQVDTEGRNCLDLAIDNGHFDVAKTIINSKRWTEALRNETLDMQTGIRNTPMRKLIKKMPDVAEIVFNNCTTRNTNNPDNPNYEITFDYEYLDDIYSDWSNKTESDALSSAGSTFDDEYNLSENAKPYSKDSTVLKMNHPLMIMVKERQEDLLAHPLVTSILKFKWQKFGRYVYYINLSLYCVFLTFLTGYILVTRPPYMFYHNSSMSLDFCNQLDEYYDTSKNTGVHTVAYNIFATVGKYIIMALAGFNILREIFQMYQSKLKYFGWENFLEWILYILTLVVVIDWNACQQATGIRDAWQWQIAAIVILLAWFELVLFIRKFPRFGIYVVMFTDILWTFIQFFPVFFLFLVAFSLSFYCLCANQFAFRRFEYSLIKTTVMMIGEMEFQDMFFGTEGVTDPDDIHGNRIYYEAITYIVYVLFLVIMSILIMNLLVGLAVDDIKAVQEQAMSKRLAMQVELVMDVENLLPDYLRRKVYIKRRTIRPNDIAANACTRMFNMETLGMSSSAIAKALDPDLDDMERLEENQEKMIGQINNLRATTTNLIEQNQKLEHMLMTMMKSQNIEYVEADAVDDDDVML